MSSTLTFAQALLQAEAQARSTLDVALHERLSAAVALVKDGRVFQSNDGTWQVDSASQEGLTYTVNGTCGCQDMHCNRPPKGLCKHRIGMYLAQRTMTLMRQPPAPVVPEVVEPWPDNDPEPAPVVETAPAAVPLPEAPASVNVRIQVHGREVQWTLRDSDETRLAARLAALLAQYPVQAPQSPQGQPQGELSQGQGAGWCPIHHTEMPQTTKDGRSWYSHKTADGWCKGRRR